MLRILGMLRMIEARRTGRRYEIRILEKFWCLEENYHKYVPDLSPSFCSCLYCRIYFENKVSFNGTKRPEIILVKITFLNKNEEHLAKKFLQKKQISFFTFKELQFWHFEAFAFMGNLWKVTSSQLLWIML